MTVRARSQAREAALKALYQLDLRADLSADAAQELVDEAELRAPEARAFAMTLVRGVLEHGEAIDVELEAVAINWKLERMAVVDRNVLRLGAFELLHLADVPPAVAINEAVLLAKKYSTKDSGAFVNGILDKVHHRAKEPVAAQPEGASAEPPQEEE